MSTIRLTLALVAAVPALAAAAPAVQPIALNQLGFEPGDVKTAIVPATAPLDWHVVDGQGRVVAQGRTEPFGQDAASGQSVQRIDFSRLREPGEGYRLVAGGLESDGFAIRANLYRPLARDALAFFYHQRAGTPIEARYVGATWARAAGHPHEVAACFVGKDERGTDWPGCGYALDVTGGWYDAGDHGKYVVNGGIALWTLLNAYERRPSAFPDGSARLPEAGNGVSDLLDEARWEMEFLLRMQVPDGTQARVPVGPGRPARPGAAAGDTVPAAFVTADVGGMAQQKVADRRWTGLPTRPADDTQARLLYPPTTAATLNLAATAAQCARIWRDIDAPFSARCLAAAERAWDAARRNPQVYATNSFTGSGGYGDGDVTDEFYWAAAELFVTTGGELYREALARSPHFTGAVREPSWPMVAPLGTITLATVPNRLAPAEIKRLRAGIIAAADGFLAEEGGNGYRVPHAADRLAWGSNGALMNRAMLLGLAHDFTGAAKYRAGVVDAIDYLLGRNPLRVSFVSGYGARSLRNPHHRFWAPSLDPKLPGPPPGVLSGGPNNTAMSDDVAATLKGKCAPQTCWVDDVRAYSLNEVAINWNAPLFWVAAWLDD